MYNEPIFLQPVFQERIWGGRKLKEDFNYPVPSNHTGEAWVISAHPNGPNMIKNGPLKGNTLRQAWNEHSELFNRETDGNEDYPLLVKILDAKTDLSVQVHPNDSYAREVEKQPYGKTECWYVLSAEPDAELVLGHQARSTKELEQLMADSEWDKLLKRVKVKAGDFVHVPSGTIHAIGSGIVILETQQSSDITYRVYDYDRTDAEGNKRELHIDKAAQVTTVPDQPTVANQFEIVTEDDLTRKRLVEDSYFTVEHWLLNGSVTRELKCDFLQVSVVDGNGKITVEDKEFELEKGTNFIVPQTMQEYRLDGDVVLIVSWI